MLWFYSKICLAGIYNIEEDVTSVFAIKLACGDTYSIGKFREQLRDWNFEIRETPHISDKNMKNRADFRRQANLLEAVRELENEIYRAA